MNNIQKLKKETVSGFVWSAFSRFYTIAVQFLLTLILARLLSPNVFAMIGLLNFFTLMSGIFVESGFLQSLVKEEKLTQVDCSSVFFFNVGIAVVVYIILFMCAPLIAIYFQMPELSTVSRVLFIQVILYSLSIVPRALLTREMRFKDLSLASTIAITLSAIVGIITAFWGFGVYALVIQILFLNMAELLLIWMQSKWIFIWKFSINSIKRFLTFSLYLLSTSIFVTFFNNLYTLIIGRYFSQSQLGYYSQAKRMEEVASLSITSMIVNVSYVAMAKVKDDVGLLKIAYQRVLSVNIYIVFPLMVFGVVSADNLIPFLLGDKWTASISYFRILCIYGAIFPLMSMNGNVLKVFVLFAVLYFPFVYFGQLSMSASFVRGTDMSSGIVNYIGALYNIIALIYLLSKNSIVRSKHTQGLTRALLVWMLLVFLNSIVNAPNVGRIFKDFNYGTMWVTHLLLYYSLARKKDINKKTVIQVFTLLIILSVILTFRMFKAMMIDLGALHALGFNAVYFVICLFPWFFLIEKRWLKMFIFL